MGKILFALTCHEIVPLNRLTLHGQQIERLNTFQEKCLFAVKHDNAQTHQLDRWMLRFLIEHALPLDDEAPAFKNSHIDDVQKQAQELSKQGRFTDFTDLASMHYTDVSWP